MAMEKTTGLSRDFIIHPGETLKEFIEDRNMSQKELAIRCGVSEKHVSTVLNGKKDISPSFAKKLEYALGIDAIFWMNLQANYDKDIIKYEELHEITDEEISVLKELKEILITYKEEKFISDNLTKIDEVMELRRIFKISNLLNIPKLQHMGAYRLKNEKVIVNPYVMFAWEKYCELIDKNENENELNIEKLRGSIPLIKSIMFHEPQNIISEITKVLKECGIRFHLVKFYKGAPVQGYIKHNESNGISLFITIRGSFADIFWFTLFHEISHILNGDAKNSFIDYDDMQASIEDKANETAAEILISKRSFEAFVERGDFSIEAIKKLAKDNDVQVFVCLGRLMKNEIIKWDEYRDYRPRYQLSYSE